jgi:membrane-associated phospholipid phosphatase
VQVRTKTALIGAGAGVALLVMTWVAAFHTTVGARADRAILHGFVGLQRPRVNALASFMTQLCDPKPFVGFCAVIILVALLRRRPRIALAAGLILLCATATTELLKDVLPASRFLPGLAHPIESWPSGHATAAMALALCAVLVAPRRLRPIVAVTGAAFAVAVGYSTLTLVWHYPSDVFGGFLVAGTWALLVVVGLLQLEAHRATERGPEDSTQLSLRSALTVPAAGCAVAAVMTGVVLLVHPHQLLSYARIHTAFVVGAAAIAALGLVVATTVMLVRR